jgi:iron complex outermembrane receptor protein
MKRLSRRLMAGGSSLALLSSVAMTAPAFAQDNSKVEQITVTGTSIRGVAPVGSNLISVDQQTIAETGAQTIAQVLVNVPAITSMGAAGQGENHTSYYQPTIHQLGSSLSNGTLVLIDGHRAPAGSTNHSVVDPNIVPVNMLERVEVLADGSSSTYGSEAIAGVINFITRKRFDGIQVNGQASFLDGAQDLTGGILVGTSTDRTSVLASYQYTHEGGLADTARPYTNPNQIPRGGTNFGNFLCEPATLQPGNTGPIFLNATSGTSLANTAANSPCSNWQYGYLLQKEVRNDGMIKGIQEIGNDITLTAELLYATRRNSAPTAAGTLQATAFSTGAQANPFYVKPTGYTGAATSETIRWDADGLLGPGTAFAAADTMYGDMQAEYRLGSDFLGGDFVVDVLALAARDDSQSGTYNTLNQSVATLALNGTTNTGGSLTTPSIPGTTTIVTSLPLTGANALDVWNPASSNRTPQTAITALRDNANVLRKVFGIEQFRASTNGTAFSLPSGPVKVALGYELLRTHLYQQAVNATAIGPASVASHSTNLLGESRRDDAVFAEIDVPIVSPEMNVPLMERLEVDLSGRYDSYNDVGNTSNPKISFNWDVITGLKLRGNWSTSFVAPSLDVAGNAQFPGYYVGNTFGGVTNNVDVPVASYPLVTQLGIAGCTAASVTCNISAIQGIQNRSGDPNVKPIRGRSWAIGFDFAPTFLQGLTTQFTYWNTEELGGITGPNFNNVIYSASLNSLVTFTPSCATPAQIAALQGIIPQTSALPACAQYLFKDPNSNYLNVKIQGIDASGEYIFDIDQWGTFRIGTSLTEFVKFDEAFGINSQGTYYSVLGTTGANTAFPSVQTAMRSHLGWSFEDLDAILFVNYTGAYRNWGTPVVPIVLDANKNPAGGGDHVNANVTFDLNMSYTFSTSWTGDDQVSLTVRNLFDKDPPFYNSTVGYDSWVANPFGRVVEIGLKAKL